MSRTDAFATIRRARTLRERHPDAPPSAVLVALTLATYADGRTGTSIRPGFERIMEDTGLGRTAVKSAVRWLESRDELRRDKQARRGSAACFTFLGVGEQWGSLSDPHSTNRGHSAANGGHSDTPHQPDQPIPPGLPGPPGGSKDGKQCRKHPTVELFQGECWECDEERYWNEYGGRPVSG